MKTKYWTKLKQKQDWCYLIKLLKGIVQTENIKQGFVIQSSNLGKNLRLMTAQSWRRALKAVKEKTGIFPARYWKDIQTRIDIYTKYL